MKFSVITVCLNSAKMMEKMMQRCGEKLEENMVKVILPVYRSMLTDVEKISVEQCRKILGRYSICVVKPKSVSIGDIEECRGLEIQVFDDRWFHSIESYNRLMLSDEFYERFMKFKFILVYQLDAFVFSDQLLSFCKLDYDYIGAPWLYGEFNVYNEERGYCHVGNGGFSLRKVKACREIIKKNLPDDINNEDLFFSAQAGESFRVAPMEVALKFSFETNVEKCFEMNKKKLPFGCHAWTKYNFAFYRKIIENFGYDTSKIHDGKLDSIKYNNLVDFTKVSEQQLKSVLKHLIPDFVNGVWIWGAGKKGMECGWLLQKNSITINGYIDSNITLQGSYLWGKKIISYREYLHEKKNNALIIAMIQMPQAVKLQLKEAGNNAEIDFTTWKELCLKLK